jgi:hypothetical protein
MNGTDKFERNWASLLSCATWIGSILGFVALVEHQLANSLNHEYSTKRLKILSIIFVPKFQIQQTQQPNTPFYIQFV